MDNNPPLLEIRDLKVIFSTGKRAVVALNNVTVNVEKGKTLGVVGQSGSGKSTLARAVMQLVRPTSGQISFDGVNLLTLSSKNLRLKRRGMQMVFQDPGGSLNPYARVLSIIAEPLLVHGIAKGKELVTRAESLLEQVGLSAKDGSKFPHEFSGGQKQRIAIARAIALKPQLLICDEPTSALDVSVQATILNLLADLRDELNLTFLFISHDLAVIHHFCDSVVVMCDGVIVETGTVENVINHPKQRVTKELIAASQPLLENNSNSPSCIV